jgi:hypothetical protein
MVVPQDPALVALRKWATLLDAAFRVPGTTFRFGLDAIIGLIPGAGDIGTAFFSVMILLHAIRLRVPKVVIGRMLINSALDMLAGTVPLVGDLFDAGYKANLKNMGLLERHAQPGVAPSRSDRIVVGAAIAVLMIVAIVPILILMALAALLSNVKFF